MPKSAYDLIHDHCKNCPSFRECYGDLDDVAREHQRSSQKRKAPREQQSDVSLKKSLVTQAVDWFLKYAPIPTEWSIKQGKLTAEQYENIVRSFTDCIHGICKDGQIEARPVTISRDLASGLAEATLRTFSYRFQVLIILSFCGYLEFKGVRKEVLEAIVKIVCGSKSISWKRLIDSALRINRLISDLASNGWSIYRATELFFLCEFSNLSLYKP